MNENTEILNADENMQKFFLRLLDLKKYVKDQIEIDQTSKALEEIYKRLDDAIKEEK